MPPVQTWGGPCSSRNSGPPLPDIAGPMSPAEDGCEEVGEQETVALISSSQFISESAPVQLGPVLAAQGPRSQAFLRLGSGQAATPGPRWIWWRCAGPGALPRLGD